MTPYAELQAVSHYSFLRGASSPGELFAQAAMLGIEAMGLADRNTLAGMVRAHEAARTTGVRLVVGSRLDLTDGASVIVYPQDRAAYGRLTRLLTLGKRRAGKGRCHLEWDDLTALGGAFSAILVPDEADDACAANLARLADLFGREAHLALSLRRRPNERLRLHDLSNLGARYGVAPVATGDVLFHVPERRVLQDVVTCIREGCTVDDAGFRRERHGDRHLKAAGEMHRLFVDHPQALQRTVAIADRCRFSLKELKYPYPDERPFPGLTPQEALEKLTWRGAAWRFSEGVPEEVRKTLRHELDLIGQMGYAPYFLTVHAIVQYARSVPILCQGRGSAANSAVCFVLGITEVDPVENNLLFERFISENRNEPPDIDVDFEHERREEVIQWIYRTYGRDRAALCATVIRYRPRGALRDVGKVFGLTDDVIRAISSQVWNWGSDIDPAFLKGTGLNLDDRRLRLTLEVAQQLVDTPRHLSQHPGGFVLTNERLDDLVPVEPAAMKDRQVIEWDKDDIEILGFMKMDVLGLGMLGCLRRGFEFLKEHKPGQPHSIAAIEAGDKATYDMICRADTIGTFQIESRAQMSMLPRLKPQEIYDLVIQIAIVRPGPIQGDMVHPYLRRREGLEPVKYPIPELEKVLGKTYGVPLFQEQAMRVAIECAGFSAGEADQLRRSMATFKARGGVSEFRDRLIDGMKEKGLEQDFAERIFRQIEGFGSYGFPESHAASFAILAYASAWMKCHHPEIFCAALLNAQPMGFYAPAQIVRDAREHEVDVRPPCVNTSDWDCMLERYGEGKLAVRLGLRMVKGLGEGAAERLVKVRATGRFHSLEDVWRRAGVPVASLTALAEADAFSPALALSRREAFWAIKALRDEPLPLFAAVAHEQNEPEPLLLPMSAGSEVVEDYRQTGLSLRAHPLLFLRESLGARGFRPCREATALPNGRLVETAGLVLMRQRPGSAKGVLFITLEDETGIANLVLWRKVFEAQRRVVLGSRLLGVRAVVQRQGEVVHLVARHLVDLSGELAGIGEFTQPQGRGDGVPAALYADTLKTKSRDFR